MIVREEKRGGNRDSLAQFRPASSRSIRRGTFVGKGISGLETDSMSWVSSVSAFSNEQHSVQEKGGPVGDRGRCLGRYSTE